MNRDIEAPAPQLRSKYEQLYEELRGQLVKGELSHERPIATEHQLADQYGVSRVTVRKALKLLEEEGLIVRKRRLGTFPAERVVPFRGGNSVAKLAEQTAWLAEHSEVRLLRFDRIKAPVAVREILGLDDGQKVTRFARIRFDDSGPIAHLTSYLAGELAAKLTKQELLREPPLVLLAHKGVVVSRTEQTVSAELASREMAEWLEVAESAPLLRTSRTALDGDEVPLSYTVARLRADRYELRYTLSEDKARAPEVWRVAEE